MNIKIVSGQITEILCDTIIVSLFEGETVPGGATGVMDRALHSHISEIIRDIPGCGKYGETTVIHTFAAIGAKRVILLGMGNENELTVDKVRAAMAVAMRAARKTHSQIVATTLHNASNKLESRLVAQAVVEGAVMGLYQFNYYKTSKNDIPDIKKLLIVENDTTKVEAITNTVHISRVIAESVNFARDMINHPAQCMTPTKMAWLAQTIAQQNGLEITVLDREEMRQKGMGALLAVSQGSAEPPKLIVLKYQGNAESRETIAFVGKGVTFDSGGLSLKPSQNMDEMKGDMAGGGAVLGAMMAIGQIKPKVNIIAVVPCTENMPSGGAFRPGDILTSMSGKTIEVLSTDAEGRLILADAITYAKKLGATKIIDIATLTGACVIGLGAIYSGVLTNNREWCKTIITAARQIGEKMWELPNDDEYTEQIKSSVADLKNTGGRPAGTITAGLFIGQFADKTPWVHIDIAGTSDTDKDKGYNLKGATGVGVRTLVQLASTLSKI
ncbi:leucyl aminopeptidase [Sporomusa acidovorans]|uniref:Probable cytosol aminopeptidase n=1 Tax=Sporomusa acidovorans (strain ATCC 49682 / DSM 3132 / Mol) TaxID=1123286 RepID=A0ABZ3J324_SPOA4|nr:leucyl aminopeptidase [Sporomusa acidovorans]OZC20147.1 cytosol aminopeptidase [Sporomusa acidovorans DSM 3132]SDD43789.1 leucyl aminopeptidase [Sporomusa acidovorans]